LTPRETEVVCLIAEGFTAKQVASQLWLSPRTVENHIARARDKVGAVNTPALVRWVVTQLRPVVHTRILLKEVIPVNH
jgi:DNA-binding CsgD family transcriptional regulator